MTNTPSDRVQIVQLGDLIHPGVCALCGSGNCDKGYVNTGVYYDYEGQVYFCWLCIEQIIELVGGLTAEEALHLKTVSEEIAAKNRELEEELDAARLKLNLWDSIIRNATGVGVNDLVPEPSESAISELSSEPADGSGNGEPTPKKPGPRRRPHDASLVKSGNQQIL